MQFIAIAASIAEDQLGLVTRRQLLGRGINPNTIDAAVRHRYLQRIERGVYQLAGAPSTPHSRLLAKVLSAGPDAVASHETAAWLWDLVPLPSRHHVTVPHHRRTKAMGLELHESRDLDLVIPGRVNGIPVTDVGRTILDCAGIAELDLECLIDEARRRLSISNSLLPWVVHRHAKKGRDGVSRLRAHVLKAGLPASDFERLAARWLQLHGVTRWTMHHRVKLSGFGPIEIDFAWPEPRVALELEGCDHRDRRLVHENDTVRQNHLQLNGWQVLRVTYGRWLRDPTGVLAELVAAIAPNQQVAPCSTGAYTPWRGMAEGRTYASPLGRV